MAIRVLIADDSALMRRKIKQILESDRGITVVGAARNGIEAVDMARQYKPDVITMDINMPEMDGITALQIIMMEVPCPVVMLSSLTQEGALTTFECLELGAIDYVGKPSGTVSVNLEQQGRQIIRKVKSAFHANVKEARRKLTPVKPVFVSSAPISTNGAASIIVAIGVSTGGPKTIMDILPFLPPSLNAAIAIVQHMPENFTAPFAKRLNESCPYTVKESEPGEILQCGQAYIAKAGIQVVFSKSATSTGTAIRHTKHPTNTPHTPSVDVMMESALVNFGSRIVGVILTGMGDDGANAMVAIRNAGGRTIAESEKTSIVFGMPAQAIERGGAEFVLPCQDIAKKIEFLVSEISRAHKIAA